MCIFGGSKPKAPPMPPPVPPPSPAPTIQPTEISPESRESSRRSRLERLRFGLSSTIKAGMSGKGAELSAVPSGQGKLGS